MASVTAMGFADSSTQPILGLGYSNQVDMIRHQTVCPDLNLSLPAPLSQQIDVLLLVLRTKECSLSTVSPLGDVMRNPWNHYPGDSRHNLPLGRRLLLIVPQAGDFLAKDVPKSNDPKML